MSRMVIKSKVGTDGVLHLDLPLGVAKANSDVQITIEAVAASAPIAMTESEWHEFIERMGGSWQGEFERPPQGEYEVRDPLS